MKHSKSRIFSAVRMLSVAIALFFALALVGCGDMLSVAVDIVNEVGGLNEEALIENYTNYSPSEVIYTTAEEYTAEYVYTTEEYTYSPVYMATEAETLPVTVEETIYYEPIPYPPTYVNEGCDHLHVEEAARYYNTYGVTMDSATQEYISTHRLAVAYGGLRLRSEPSTETKSNQVGLILDGSIVELLYYNDGWAYTSYNGVEGWCSMEYLFEPFVAPTTELSIMARGTALQKTKLVVDRTCYDKDEVSTYIPRSAEVKIYSISGDTAFVSYENIYGYCSASDLQIRYY